MQGQVNQEIPQKLIDIEALFASKNPTLLKVIPRFILSYLKRIIHQDEINGYIYKHREKSGLPFVRAILEEFGVNVTVEDRRSPPAAGTSIIPVTGRYIIASNHPLGGLDGMALMQELGEVRTDIVFPVNDLLMNVPGLRPLFIPINKHGKNTGNAKLIVDTFASEKVVLYFPAGLVSRRQKLEGRRVIRDLEWKNTFIKKARQYERDIIPIYIDGRNSDWFYNLAYWRKRLGIKANIEMLYLVDEMVKQLNQTITLRIGDTIPHGRFDRSRTDNQWAEYVKGLVYSMA